MAETIFDKQMRILVFAILTLAALACGGNSVPGTAVALPTSTITPTATQVQVPSGGPIPTVPTTKAGDPRAETALRARVEAALAFASNGDWLAAHEFYALSFGNSCPAETFAAQITSGMILLRDFVGVPLKDSLEFRLMSVTVIGDYALVGTQIFHNGEPLEYGGQDELDSWALIDGEWWNNVQPGPEGCVN